MSQDLQDYSVQDEVQNSKPAPNVRSPLVWSILSMIFCCFPTGIISIIYAAKVNSLLAAGKKIAAAKAASSARMWAWISVVLGLLTIIFMILLLIPAISAVGEAAKNLQNANNIKQLSVAMHTYSSERNGVLPPAYTEKDGMRLHSWRVAILPYLEERELYEQIRLDEPWDSEWNKQFHDKCPTIFRNPKANLAPGETTFAVVVGENTAFPGSEAASLSNIPDGISNTVMIVERSPVCWMDPNSDVPFEEAIKGVNVSPNGIKSYFNGIIQVTLCNCYYCPITDKISSEDLRKLILINDGEMIDMDELSLRP